MRKLLATLALIATLLGISLIHSAPASAAPPPGCLTPYVCLYVNANYGGFSKFYNVGANPGCTTFTSTLNNNIESIYGNYVGTGRWIGYFNSHNCTGTVVFGWSSGGAYPTLPSSARNVISSMRIDTLP